MKSQTIARFRIGVIEGFFGKPWRWEDRLAYPKILSELGYTDFIYAPKADSILRKNWGERWNAETRQQVERLAADCSQYGIQFGIGLSPYEIYLHWDGESRHALREKVREIREVAPESYLALLFDDMRGDVSKLAQLQAEISHFVCETAHASELFLCPTYYSTDPVLERVFGNRPAHYWEDLGKLLPPSIQVFWTGERVISEKHDVTALGAIGAKLRRAPVLWDNYPVNDTKRLSDRLLLKPFSGRPRGMKSVLSGHFVNPMKQARLSVLPLCSLPMIYAGASSESLYQATLERIEDSKLRRQVEADLEFFAEKGLSGISNAERELLSSRYLPFAQDPCGKEILGWISGDDAFDPDCLTT